MLEQRAYAITDEIFESFYENNKQFLWKLPYEKITALGNDKTKYYGNTVFDYPWSIRHVGKLDGGDGDDYLMFNDKMELVYTYNNAE
jgi:hypothetical protein